MTAVDTYIDAIVRRAREPMEPRGFEPDWGDQPRRHKYYPGAVRLPLPPSSPLPGSLGRGLGSEGEGEWTLPRLSSLLRDSYGLTGRRLAVHGNPDLRGMPWFPSATWSRGVASGGGLYPLEVYWVSGPSGPLPPGIYNYSTPHHSMQRLLAGDVTPHVRAALPRDARDTDQYLLISVKFWKNSFKYNSFCYHAVTMDVGTLLGTWSIAARAAGLSLKPLFWFDEPALDELLGLDSGDESVLAVVPLPWTGSDPRSAATPVGRPSVKITESERSREVVRFSQVLDVHREILGSSRAEPDEAGLAKARALPAPAATSRRLPPPAPLDVPVTTTLRERRSGFGRFSAERPLAQRDLSAILTAAGDASTLLNDTGLTRVSVFANHVADLPAGSYDFATREGELRSVQEHSVAEFLQRNYFLNNYNLEQCAAVVTVVARPAAVTEVVGPRGYRLVNAEVGAVTQSVYLACAALGVGCGAALGFDNVSYREELRITDETEWPLLILMIGHERGGQPEFVYRNV